MNDVKSNPHREKDEGGGQSVGIIVPRRALTTNLCMVKFSLHDTLSTPIKISRVTIFMTTKGENFPSVKSINSMVFVQCVVNGCFPKIQFSNKIKHNIVQYEPCTITPTYLESLRYNNYDVGRDHERLYKYIYVYEIGIRYVTIGGTCWRQVGKNDTNKYVEKSYQTHSGQ